MTNKKECQNCRFYIAITTKNGLCIFEDNDPLAVCGTQYCDLYLQKASKQDEE